MRKSPGGGPLSDQRGRGGAGPPVGRGDVGRGYPARRDERAPLVDGRVEAPLAAEDVVSAPCRDAVQIPPQRNAPAAVDHQQSRFACMPMSHKKNSWFSFSALESRENDSGEDDTPPRVAPRACRRVRSLRLASGAWGNLASLIFIFLGGLGADGNQMSGAPRRRRDVAKSARWRGASRPSTRRRCPRDRVGSTAWTFTEPTSIYAPRPSRSAPRPRTPSPPTLKPARARPSSRSSHPS